MIICGFGSKDYSKAAQRLYSQAAKLKVFRKIFVFTEFSQVFNFKDIKLYTNLSSKYPRGHGLWSWKPAIIYEVMKSVPLNSVIFYIDAGCEISVFGKNRLINHIKNVSIHDSLFFWIPFKEFEWTQRSVLNEFRLRNNDSTSQIQATWFGLVNNKKWQAFVLAWKEKCLERKLFFSDFNSSKSSSGLISHRDDQSILSCMLKHNNIGFILPWEDHFLPELYYENSWVLLAPVHTLRNRYGLSKINILIKKSTYSNCINNREKFNFLSIKLFLIKRFFKDLIICVIKPIL